MYLVLPKTIFPMGGGRAADVWVMRRGVCARVGKRERGKGGGGGGGHRVRCGVHVTDANRCRLAAAAASRRTALTALLTSD